MSSSGFTQRRRQEHQGQAAARAEEKRAETAHQIGGDGHTWTRTWGKNGDKIIRLDPKITDGKGSWRKGNGTDRCWGKWSPSAGYGGPRWSGRTNCPESGCRGEVARPMSLPPEEPLGLVVVRGKGKGNLLPGLIPGVNSLIFSGVVIAQTPVVTRMSEGSREPPVVGNRKERQGGKHQSSIEVGGGAGAAAVIEIIALLERLGRSPVESSEDICIKQVVPAAKISPPVACQPAGTHVVYTATGKVKGLQAAGMSQQSMCAGVPPTGMAPQWEIAVVDPGIVIGVMAVKNMNPLQRVEALIMSSPQTPVKEPSYPTMSQELIYQGDAREKKKYEELKQYIFF